MELFRCYLFVSFIVPALSSLEFAPPQSCANPDADVLILGAGMSGIMAAKTLHDAGTTDFIILEALDRIGGRMRTAEIAGVKVELGANWIQGVDPNDPDRNPIMRLARICGLQIQFSNYESRYLYNQTGANITGSPSLRFDDYNNADDVAESVSINRRRMGQPDISSREGLEIGGWVPNSADDNWVDWFGFDFCSAQPPEVSSLFESIPDRSYTELGPDNYFVVDQRGYAYVADCIAEEFLQEERLHLNTNVSQIEWSDDCVCATATEGTVERLYCAPYGIVTFSLGVLQAEPEVSGLRFVPELPQSKRDTIDKLSMAHYLKIFLEFNETFWDANVQYIGYVHSERGYYAVFQPLGLFLPGNPHLIFATIVYHLADQVVRQPVEVTKQQLMEVLRSIYGDDVPEPIDIIVPDWRLNPLFLGTYSNTPVGVTDETFVMLAAPVGHLYFSGEATSAAFFGYVHGAYYAGISTANAVLDARAFAGILSAGKYTVWLVIVFALLLVY